MISAAITLPEILLASPRQHNKQVNDALHLALYKHLKVTMPRHFDQDAAGRYKHAKRNPRYIAYKVRRFKTGRDLVKTGESQKMLPATARIVISGGASEQTLRGRLTCAMSFRGEGASGRTLDEDALRRLEAALLTERDPHKLEWIRQKLRNQKTARGKSGVTAAQMVKEMQTILPEEAAAISADIGAFYIQWIREMRRPRLVAGASLPSL